MKRILQSKRSSILCAFYFILFFSVNLRANSIVSLEEDNTVSVAAHYDYLPYGELRQVGDGTQTVNVNPNEHMPEQLNSFVWDNEFRYQTKFWDKDAQLYYSWHRYYNPVLGTWMSEDPLGSSDSYNLYQYCNTNPVNYSDPDGQFFISGTVIAYLAIQATWAVAETAVEARLTDDEDFSIGGTFAKNFLVNSLTGGIGGKANKAVSVLRRFRNFTARQTLEVGIEANYDIHVRGKDPTEAVMMSAIGGVMGEGLGRAAGLGIKKFTQSGGVARVMQHVRMKGGFKRAGPDATNKRPLLESWAPAFDNLLDNVLPRFGIRTRMYVVPPSGRGAGIPRQTKKNNTEPGLPPETVVDAGSIQLKHWYRSNDHAPAHIHVYGEGASTKIGANGNPLSGFPEISTKQRKVVEANLPLIRAETNRIRRWLRFQRLPEE